MSIGGSRIGVVRRIEECLVDEIVLPLVLFAEPSGILLIAEDVRDSRHKVVTLGKHTVADKIYGARVCLVDSLWSGPVSKIPVSVLCPSPVLEKTIHTFAFRIIQPPAHIRIIPFHKPFVSIIEPCLP